MLLQHRRWLGEWFDTVVEIPRGLTACDNPSGNPVAELIGGPVIDQLLVASKGSSNG